MCKVSIVGLGKLGLPMAAAIGAKGFTVIGIDNNPQIIRDLSRGKIHIREANLEQYLDIAMAGQRLTFTSDIAQAIRETDMTFIIVPTPSLADGTFSNEYVFEALTDIGKALVEKDSYHLIIVTSTVMPGTMIQARGILEQISGKKCSDDFGLCYSPEFIALGSVIDNFLEPDFVLIGESDPVAGDKLSQFYWSLCSLITYVPIVRMSYENAELAKLALNCFVVTKITFANFLARLCEGLPGGDVDAVTNAISLDSRIGRKYLTGGAPYGGPCFPRDTKALAAVAEKLGVLSRLPAMIGQLNCYNVEHIFDMVLEATAENQVIAVLGLAYKAGTHITEESAGLRLVELLESSGCTVVVHDPYISDTDTAQSCVDVAQTVVLMLPYQEFAELEYKPGQTVIDCWRVLRSFIPVGVKYIGLGLGKT